MISQFCNRLELGFWNWAIPTLTNNLKVRRMIGKFRSISLEHPTEWYLLRAALAGAAGLVCGFSGYFLFVH